MIKKGLKLKKKNLKHQSGKRSYYHTNITIFTSDLIKRSYIMRMIERSPFSISRVRYKNLNLQSYCIKIVYSWGFFFIWIKGTVYDSRTRNQNEPYGCYWFVTTHTLTPVNPAPNKFQPGQNCTKLVTTW